MAKKDNNKRAQGGGRTPNSEPKLQVFKDFGGINFELANRYTKNITVDTKRTDNGDQTDLQMNFMFLQNNVATMSNKTMETRDDVVYLFNAPFSGDISNPTNFSGPVCLVGNRLYAALTDGSVRCGNIDDRYTSGEPITLDNSTKLSLVNHTDSDHTWTSFGFYDNKLVALTSQNEMWTGDVSSYVATSLENAQQLPNASASLVVTGKGSLRIDTYQHDEYQFRFSLGNTWVNKYGPTKLVDVRTWYANHPITEWHSGCYASILGTMHPNGASTAEIYYSTEDSMQMLFLARVDLDPDVDPEHEDTTWRYNWYGYIDSTSMWPTANLIAPTENYTKGVHASHMCDIDGRLYFWGDSSNQQRLYIGGNPGNLLSISPGTGGGFVDVEPGTLQKIRHVCKYKTQSGNSIVTMLCDSPNTHHEQRFNLVENSISLSNEQNMKSWQAEQVAGAVGCKSYKGAVVCQDGLYSISRYGLALTTMTMEYNSQIKTTYISDPIKLVFTDAVDRDTRLGKAMLLECDGVLYMALGNTSDAGGDLDNVIFCYDIATKAWWTYTLDMDTPIINMFHVDWQGRREGIGIVTASSICMLPTTVSDNERNNVSHDFLIQTAQLSTQMPQQGWQYLSQLEFHFDYFIGDMTIELKCFDMFGRKLSIKKVISEETEQFDYVVHMRIDQRVMSYVLIMNGTARFRMTHFIARVYTLSNKIGQVWGFDDSISYRTSGSVHPTFKSYNELRKAIFT